VPPRGGAVARFKVYAVAAGGVSRMDVTGESQARLQVRLLPPPSGRVLHPVFRAGQISHAFVVLSAQRGRQLQVQFRRPVTQATAGQIEVRYRYGRDSGEQVTARFHLTLEPLSP